MLRELVSFYIYIVYLLYINIPPDLASDYYCNERINQTCVVIIIVMREILMEMQDGFRTNGFP